MGWDYIDGNNDYEFEVDKFFSIGELIDVCNQNPDCVVYFVGTQMAPGKLGSWRGSYDIPAIEPIYEDRTGKQVARQLEEDLKKTHYGYKGGEYKYCADSEFYISPYGSAREYKVAKAEVVDGELILYTKLDPY